MAQTVAVHLPDETVEQLDAVAEREDRSRSAVARRLLQGALKPHEFGDHVGVVHFATQHTPPSWYDIAIATLGPVPPETFEPGDNTTPLTAARWTAQRFEDRTSFEARIRAELKAEGAGGAMVTIYEHSSFWQRNALGTVNVKPGHPFEVPKDA